MSASDMVLEGEPPEIERWFETSVARLHEHWSKATGHSGECRDVRRRLACEILSRCGTGDRHLSVGCSVGSEADEIGQFLMHPWSSGNPLLFFRLYLIILSEFVRGLNRVADLIGFKLADPPTKITVWCNKFAKHRQDILIQHHPIYVFADSYGNTWSEFESLLPTMHFIDRCGNRRPLTIIDYRWLVSEKRERSIEQANSNLQPVVVVPPWMEFMECTIRYFQNFVSACVSQPERFRQFESEQLKRGCFG